MFGLFKQKSKIEILNKKYQKLLEEAYKLSTSSRVQSDLKQAEAEEVLKEIKALENSGSK